VFLKRTDIPNPIYVGISDAISGVYVAKSGKDAMKEVSFRVPKPLYLEIKRFQRKNGNDQLLEAILQCLHAEVK
jgi:hypothetical protein